MVLPWTSSPRTRTATCIKTRWLRLRAEERSGEFEGRTITASHFHYTGGSTIVEAQDRPAYSKGYVGRSIGLISYAVRWEDNAGCRGPSRSGGGAQFSAQGRGATLPIGRSTRKCEEWRTGQGTWSWGSPWTDKSDRCRNPRWGRAGA